MLYRHAFDKIPNKFRGILYVLWILRDLAGLSEFRGYATTLNIRSPDIMSCVIYIIQTWNWRLKICIWWLYFSSWSPKGDLTIYIISSLVLPTEVYAWTVTLLSHKRSTRCPLIYHHLILTLDWKFRWYILSHFVFTKWNSKPWHIFKVVIKALLWSVWAHKDYFERLSFWNYLFIGLNQLWCESSAWWALQKKVPQASHWRDSGWPIKHQTFHVTNSVGLTQMMEVQWLIQMSNLHVIHQTQFIFSIKYNGLQCLPMKINYSNLCIRFGT